MRPILKEMPTLPLYTPAAHPDAWHRVTAPGGYERWYFEAEDASGDLRLVATLQEGCDFDPAYLRRYAAYRRNPTRHRPPQPGEYPCVAFAVYQGGRALARFVSQYPPGALTASPNRPEVAIGPNEFRSKPDRSLRLRLQGPPSHPLSAELTLRPLSGHAPTERLFVPPALAEGADHHCILANPRCAVTGTINIGGGNSTGPHRVVHFDGRGYHDHHYGTAPIGQTLRRWARGTVFYPDFSYVFRVVGERSGKLPDRVDLFRSDAEGVREITEEAATAHWSRRADASFDYPAELRFGTRLRLFGPTVLEASRAVMHLSYRAAAHGGRELGNAFCELSHPPNPR